MLIEMPFNYIIEMMCDWWAHSLEYGDMSLIFYWYDNNKDYIKLAPKTRKTVEYILLELKERLGYNTIAHHGIKGQKWGVRNGPPYPLDKSKKWSKIKISEEKFTKYALDFDKNPNKATAFDKALGYTKNNCKKLIQDIESNLDENKMIEKGDSKYGKRYQQVMRLKGPNGKEANVLTAWIDDGAELRLTSTYVTKKEETK